MATSGIELRTLQDWLVGSRNADGGWGYYPSKKSRLEPTCWALLALRGCSSSDAWCRQVLGGWPTANALLVERKDGTPNFAFHALALLTLGAYAIDHAHDVRRDRAVCEHSPPRRLITEVNAVLLPVERCFACSHNSAGTAVRSPEDRTTRSLSGLGIFASGFATDSMPIAALDLRHSGPGHAQRCGSD